MHWAKKKRGEETGTMIENAATEQIAMKRRSPGRFALLTMALVVAFGVAAFLIAGCGDNLSAAKAAELAGDLKTAERLYQERLQVHPDDLGAIKGIAGVLYLERKWTEALPYQEKAVARDAREAQIRVELGFNYLNHQSSPQKALVVFQEASTIEPTVRKPISEALTCPAPTGDTASAVRRMP